MDTKLGYIVILPWMREELDLKGNELLVFALIHGFSQESQGCFFGSLDYVCKACGCSRPTAIETLKKLRERGLIHKRELTENNVKMCQYSVLPRGSQETLLPVKNLNGGSQISLLGGSQEILPNNKAINDNKKIVKGSPAHTPFILPFSSDKFRETWEALIEEKEWKKKSHNALRLALKDLGKFDEEFAIELMEKTIKNGWKGVVFADTDQKFQEWKSARQQAIDNAQPRTAIAQRAKPLPQNNQIDEFYRKQREQEQREREEQLAQLKAKYGYSD